MTDGCVTPRQSRIGLNRRPDGGFLAVHKQDFLAHASGVNNNHCADQINMNPELTSFPGSTVQTSLEAIGTYVESLTNDHSLLTNLSSDDHLQYLNRSGIRPMTGDLDIDSNYIISNTLNILGTPIKNNLIGEDGSGNITVGDTSINSITLNAGIGPISVLSGQRNGIGQDISIISNNSSSGAGSDLLIRSGDGATTGGNFSLISGDGNSNDGGTISILSGSSTNADGGNISIVTGEGKETGGNLELRANTGTDVSGGNISLIAGDSDLLGGSVSIYSGGVGTTSGDIIISTASASTDSGDITLLSGSTVNSGDINIISGGGTNSGNINIEVQNCTNSIGNIDINVGPNDFWDIYHNHLIWYPNDETTGSGIISGNFLSFFNYENSMGLIVSYRDNDNNEAYQRIHYGEY